MLDNPNSQSLESLHRFVQWYVHHGGYIHPALEVVENYPHGLSMRVGVDGDAIRSKTAILSCPHAVTISYCNAMRIEPFETHSESFPSAFLQQASPRTVTVFFLSQQYLLGEQSFWWPYLRILPQPSDTSKLCTPLWFSDEDTVWLRGTNVEKGCSDRVYEWKKQWAEGVYILDAAGWNTEDYAWWVLTSQCMWVEMVNKAYS